MYSLLPAMPWFAGSVSKKLSVTFKDPKENSRDSDAGALREHVGSEHCGGKGIEKLTLIDVVEHDRYHVTSCDHKIP